MLRLIFSVFQTFKIDVSTAQSIFLRFEKKEGKCHK